MYQVGDWIKNKHSGYIAEIIQVYDKTDGRHQYVVKWLNSSHYGTRELNYSTILEFYDHLKMARLLYTNNSNKAVTNETNEK